MTIDELLIPTDGSAQAEAAAAHGFGLAAQLDARVRILSVADRAIAASASYSGDSQAIRESLRETATERASTLRDTAEGWGLDAMTSAREGIPAEEIIAAARSEPVDAIVLGTTGRGKAARAVLGSVADKVIRTSPVPVISISPKATSEKSSPDPVESMLIPTDGSGAAEAAGRRGFDLAAQLAASVHVFSVATGASTELLSGLRDDDSDSEISRENAERLADGARERGLETTTATDEGAPATAILDRVEEAGIDMVAMGTTGQGTFERLLVGSVTDEVVCNAPVPVATFRATTTEENDA